MTTDGATITARIEAGAPVAHRGGRLPVGLFTPEEFSRLIARMNFGVTFADGVVTVNTRLYARDLDHVPQSVI